MKMKRWIVILGLFCLLIESQVALAAVPPTLSYQGVLKQGDGSFVPDGDYTITFRIYDQPSAGTALWTEAQNLPVSGGIFDAIIGSVTALDLDFALPYWLGVQIGTDEELTPRVEMTAAAYTFRAAVADSVAGLDYYADADWEIDGDDIYRLGGKIGIGTDAPVAPLTFLPIVGSEIEFATGTGNNADIMAGGQFNIGTLNSNYLNFFTDNMYRMSISGAGRVGIGTTSPAEQLDVAGTLQATGFKMPTAAGDGYVLTSDATGAGTWQPAASGDDGDWTIAGDDVYRSGGKVGIGTASPTRTLHVREDVNNYAGIRIENQDTGASSREALTFDNEDGSLAGIYMFDVSGAFPNGMAIFNNRPGGEIRLNTNGLTRLNLDNAGQLGIGTSSPSERLDVNGTAKMTGFQLSTSPAEGHVLTADASGVGTWQAPDPLDLPYDDYVASWDPAFRIRQLSSGMVADFEIDEPTGDAAVISAETNGTGPALEARSQGTVVVDVEATSTVWIDHTAVQGVSVQADWYGKGGVFQGGFVGAEGNVYPTGNHTYSGLYGNAHGGTGVNYGVYGTAFGSGTNYAGYFSGDVEVTGVLNKGGGSFKIDHPLDPENKYLYHSFVESPDMMNVYNDNVVLDAVGEAWIEMPEWFQALNRDFRYQLTAIGAPGPNLYVAEKITGNRFKIAGGSPGAEVSWQVTGIRQDAFAEKNRIPVEVGKTDRERGKYLHPEAHGLSAEHSLNHEFETKMARSGSGRSSGHDND